MKDGLSDGKHESDGPGEESDLKETPLMDSGERLGRHFIVINKSEAETTWANKNSDLSGRRELFGTPRVEATIYYCKKCALPILSQEIVWKERWLPHCPDCGSRLDQKTRE